MDCIQFQITFLRISLSEQPGAKVSPTYWIVIATWQMEAWEESEIKDLLASFSLFLQRFDHLKQVEQHL